jgi:phosphoribosylformylglycinamidine synthase
VFDVCSYPGSATISPVFRRSFPENFGLIQSKTSNVKHQTSNSLSFAAFYTIMEVTAKTAKQLRLTEEEFESIKQKLGRTPNFNELCAFSGMWSEHCSYKNSIKWLKTLPREGGRMLVKAGEENAGLMDIGEGYGVVFKIESHNHPSAIEPFQGAATGVGGIHRDIFTMGARPIASLNSLRFGKLDDKKTQHLLAGVVHGISHYGNCFGVPTVGGEVYFDECYHTNPLVNAMSVGIVQVGKTVSATAAGAGNPVMYVGSATGKDGIGGASFASAEITSESAEELPAVQVGDPFQEKKLLEACLEVIETGAVVGMQDMGAAGIICSTAEMSAKGGVGMHIDLDKVPMRQQAMKAWELLLSESQERMLLVVEKGREDDVKKVFDKWDLENAVIGYVKEDGLLSFHMNGSLEAEIPAEELVLGGGAPQYDREFREPAYFQKIKSFDINSVPQPESLKEVAEQLIQVPSIANKRWVYHQYDSMVGTVNASTNAPSDAAIVLVKETGRGLAVTVDCNSRFVYADPYKGAMIAVAEAARNIVCSGGLPLGVTNCLNFGNPYDPEVYYQFVNAVKGMGEACRCFDTPVTGGNVSFYNQNPDGPVFPTPTIGMVGLVEDLTKQMSMDFKEEGDEIFLLGIAKNDIASSQYLSRICGVEASPAPYFELEEEYRLQQCLAGLIKEGLLRSAHDVSEGGIITALLESAFPANLGFQVATPASADAASGIRPDAFWFGEAQSRVIVSVSEKARTDFWKAVQASDVPFISLGKVTIGTLIVDGEPWGLIEDWKNLYDTAIERHLTKELDSEGALTMI